MIDQLDRNKEQRKVIRRRRKEHPGEREYQQPVVFGNPRRNAVGIFDRDEQHDDGGDQEKAFEKQRQAVEHVALAEGVKRRGGVKPDKAVREDRSGDKTARERLPERPPGSGR